MAARGGWRLDPQLFRTKSIDQLISDADQPETKAEENSGWLSLTALGVGAIIGSGIFVLTGTAAAGETVQFPSILKAPLLDVLMHGKHALGISGRPGAGPGIAVSFFVVAVICGLAGLCYAELASMIPIAGSAYTYTYATMGELVAWIIGWDLILEYAVSNMAVAVGFSSLHQQLARFFWRSHSGRLEHSCLYARHGLGLALQYHGLRCGDGANRSSRFWHSRISRGE